MAVKPCLNCGTSVHAESTGCPECGYDFTSGEMPAPAPTAPSYDYSGVKGDVRSSDGASGAAVFSGVLVAVAVFLLIVGFVVPDNAITQTALFAAAAVVGILARMVQAAGHHAALMDQMRKR